jgi:hypothetical protein
MPQIDHPPVTLGQLEAEGRTFAAVWEVANIFESDPRTIRRQCREGGIPHVKIGAEYKISVAWLRHAASGRADPEIAALAAAAPPLTPGQRARLAALLGVPGPETACQPEQETRPIRDRVMTTKPA